jgi:hypothetical protein
MANQKNQTGNEGGTKGQSAGRGKQQGDMSATGTGGNIGSPMSGGISQGETGSSGSELSGTGSSITGATGTAGQSGIGSTTSSGSGTGAGTAVARSLYDQAKETAGQAYGVAAEKATSKLEEQKSTLSGGLATVADSVRRVSDNLRGPDVQDGIAKFTAEYSDVAARKIEGVANYFEQKSVSEMYTDVENFARRNPAVFVGGAFALGLLLSRFLKSGTNEGSYRGRSLSGSSRSGHEGPISTASDEGSGQGIQGISGIGGTTPGASIS